MNKKSLTNNFYKVIFALILISALAVGVLVLPAFSALTDKVSAAGENYAMSLGTTALKGGQASTVYMGRYANGTSKGTGTGIPWKVLDASTGLVLSEYILGDTSIAYNNAYNATKYSFWSNSNMRAYLNGGTSGASATTYGTAYNGGILTEYFTAQERDSIALSQISTQKYDYVDSNNRYKTTGQRWLTNWTADAGTAANQIYQYQNGVNPSGGSGTANAYANGKETTYDKLFLLDYSDVADTSSATGTSNAAKYGFRGTMEPNGSTNGGYTVADNSRIAYRANTGAADYWWTRGSGAFTSTAFAVMVYTNGQVNPIYNVINAYGVRPAFNLNLSSVLFTSAAAGGKISGTVGAAALKAQTSASAATSFKLTVNDSARSAFSASVTGVSSGKQQIRFSGAKTGAGEMISGIVTRGNDIRYYGNFVANVSTAAGTCEAKLPDDFNEATDKLYIFNEHLSGDNSADYSSPLKEVTPQFNFTVPTQKTVPEFAGVTLNAVDYLQDYDPAAMTISGQTTGYAAGTYTVTVSLINKNPSTGAPWANQSNQSDYADKTVTWTIQPKKITVAWTNTSQVYTGAALRPTARITVFKTDGSGATEVKDANITFDGFSTPDDVKNVRSDYTARASLPSEYASNYVIVSGITSNFAITKAQNSWVTAPSRANWTQGDNPTVPAASAVFGGTPTFTYSVDRNGTYTSDLPAAYGVFWMKASLAGTENYGALEGYAQFEVFKNVLVDPVGLNSDSLIYNGLSQTADITRDVNDERYVITGNTAKNAGAYTATITLNDGYSWTSGGRDPITVSWNIAKREVAYELISGAPAITKVYNGTVDIPVTSVSNWNVYVKISNPGAGDNLTVTGTGTFSNYLAETGKSITFVVAGISDTDNYRMPSGAGANTVTGLSGSITPKTLTVAASGVTDPPIYWVPVDDNDFTVGSYLIESIYYTISGNIPEDTVTLRTFSGRVGDNSITGNAIRMWLTVNGENGFTASKSGIDVTGCYVFSNATDVDMGDIVIVSSNNVRLVQYDVIADFSQDYFIDDTTSAGDIISQEKLEQLVNPNANTVDTTTSNYFQIIGRGYTNKVQDEVQIRSFTAEILTARDGTVAENAGTYYFIRIQVTEFAITKGDATKYTDLNDNIEPFIIEFRLGSKVTINKKELTIEAAPQSAYQNISIRKTYDGSSAITDTSRFKRFDGSTGHYIIEAPYRNDSVDVVFGEGKSSARFSGTNASDADTNKKSIELRNLTSGNDNYYFGVSSVTLASAGYIDPYYVEVKAKAGASSVYKTYDGTAAVPLDWNSSQQFAKDNHYSIEKASNMGFDLDLTNVTLYSVFVAEIAQGEDYNVSGTAKGVSLKNLALRYGGRTTSNFALVSSALDIPSVLLVQKADIQAEALTVGTGDYVSVQYSGSAGFEGSMLYYGRHFTLRGVAAKDVNLLKDKVLFTDCTFSGTGSPNVNSEASLYHLLATFSGIDWGTTGLEGNYNVVTKTVTVHSAGLITPKEVEIEVNSSHVAINKPYDGDDRMLGSVTLVKDVHYSFKTPVSDNISLALGADGYAYYRDGKNAYGQLNGGIAVYKPALTGYGSSNYIIINVNDITKISNFSLNGKVQKAKVTITVNSTSTLEGKVYDGTTDYDQVGQEQVTLGKHYTLSATPDAVSVIFNPVYESKNVRGGGYVLLKPTLNADDNYEFANSSGSLDAMRVMSNISEKELTLKDITSTANVFSKIYDGRTGFDPLSPVYGADPIYTDFNWNKYIGFNGLAAGETSDGITLKATASFASKDVGTGNYLRVTLSTSGNFTDQNNNYRLSTAQNTLDLAFADIAARTLTVTKGALANTNKAFDFSAELESGVSLGGAYVLGNFAGTEGSGVTLGVKGFYTYGGQKISSARSGNEVYSILLEFDGTVLGSASVVKNYRVDPDALSGAVIFGDAGYIYKRSINVEILSDGDYVTKTYDGTLTLPDGEEVKAGTHFKFDYEIPADYYGNFKVTVQAGAAFKYKDVFYNGQNSFIFSIDTLNDDLGNFEIGSYNSRIEAKAWINPAPVTLRAKTNAGTIDKSYDGSPDVTAAVSYIGGFFDIEGAMSGEAFVLSNYNGKYLSGAAEAFIGDGLDVSVTMSDGYIAAGNGNTDMRNYTLKDRDGNFIGIRLAAKGNIAKVRLTVEQAAQSAFDLIEKTYDGTKSLPSGKAVDYASGKYFVLKGLVGHVLDVAVGSAGYTSKDVAENGLNKIEFTITSIGGTGSEYYDFAGLIDAVFEIDGRINKVTLRIEHDTAAPGDVTKTYDGTDSVDAAATKDVLKSFLKITGNNLENLAISNTFDVRFDSADAGAKKLLYENLSLDFSGAVQGNYDVVYGSPLEVAGKATITPKEVTAAIGATSWSAYKEYDGLTAISGDSFDPDMIRVDPGAGFGTLDLRLANKVSNGIYSLEGTLDNANAGSGRSVEFKFDGSNRYYVLENGAVSKNFVISASQAMLTLTGAVRIDKRVITVSETNETFTRQYTGDLTVDLSELTDAGRYYRVTNEVTAGGVRQEITLNVLSAAFNYANAGMATSIRVTLDSPAFSVSNGDAANYTVSNFTLPARITAKVLDEYIDATGETVKKTYDGTNDASKLTESEVNRLIDYTKYALGETLSVRSFSARYETADAGFTTLVIKDIVLSNANYTIGEIWATGEIEKATVTVVPAEGYVLSGAAMPVFAYTVTGKPTKGAALDIRLYLIDKNNNEVTGTNVAGRYSFAYEETGRNANYNILFTAATYEIRTRRLTEDGDSNSNNSEVNASNSSGFADGMHMQVNYVNRDLSNSFREEVEEEGRIIGVYQVMFYTFDANGEKNRLAPEGLMTVSFKLSTQMQNAKNLNIIVVENGVKRVVDNVSVDASGFASFTTRGISEFGVFDNTALSAWEKNMGLWIGLIVGGVAFIILLFLLIWLYKKHKAKKNETLAGYRALPYGYGGYPMMGAGTMPVLGLNGNVAASSTAKKGGPRVPRNANGQKIDMRGRPIQEAKVVSGAKAAQQKKSAKQAQKPQAKTQTQAKAQPKQQPPQQKNNH